MRVYSVALLFSSFLCYCAVEFRYHRRRGLRLRHCTALHCNADANANAMHTCIAHASFLTPSLINRYTRTASSIITHRSLHRSVCAYARHDTTRSILPSGCSSTCLVRCGRLRYYLCIHTRARIACLALLTTSPGLVFGLASLHWYYYLGSAPFRPRTARLSEDGAVLGVYDAVFCLFGEGRGLRTVCMLGCLGFLRA